MAARAIWKGVIRLGGVDVPVKLYAAVQDRGVHFRLLHAADLVPVKQRMVHPGTGEPVNPADIRRGFRLDDGRYVLLSDDELASVAPPPSRDIEITRFVDASAVDPAWYDRPYFLGPDGDVGAYAALAAALAARGVVGVARWAMRKQRYLGALRAADGHLMLHTLRHADEVVSAPAVEVDEHARPTAAEMRMAVQLVTALAGQPDIESLRDEHRDRVLALIDAKVKGQVVPLAQHRPRRDDEPLADALRQSLRALRASG